MPTRTINKTKASRQFKKVKTTARAEDVRRPRGKHPRVVKIKSPAQKVSRVGKVAAQPEAGSRSAKKALGRQRGFNGQIPKFNNTTRDSSRQKALSSAMAGGKKSAAKLSKSDLEYFRRLLLDKRREILGDVGSMESEAFRDQDNHSSSPMHMADVGTDNFEQEFTLGLLQSERELLKEIQEALNRIDNGSFGICAATGKPIGRARLEAKPWAKYCIEYARLMENNALPRHSGTSTAIETAEEEE